MQLVLQKVSGNTARFILKKMLRKLSRREPIHFYTFKLDDIDILKISESKKIFFDFWLISESYKRINTSYRYKGQVSLKNS